MAATAGGAAGFDAPDPASLDRLAAHLRGPDGRPLALDAPTDDGALLAVDAAGHQVEVLVDRLTPSIPGGPATIVSVTPLGDAPAQLVQRALGGVLAHALRTPLTTIYGGAQLVRDHLASEATRDEAALAVAREAQRLLEVIENLVVLARFEPPRAADLEPVLLQRVLPGVVEAERVAAPSLVFSVDLPADLPAVRASVRHVEHAFRNLLVWAVQSSRPHGEIAVTGRLAGDAVEVRVADLGARPSDADAAHAFDLFARSPRTTADASGVNLGLFISRRLIQGMDGRIWVGASTLPGSTAGARSGAESGFALPVAEDAGDRPPATQV